MVSTFSTNMSSIQEIKLKIVASSTTVDGLGVRAEKISKEIERIVILTRRASLIAVSAMPESPAFCAQLAKQYLMMNELEYPSYENQIFKNIKAIADGLHGARGDFVIKMVNPQGESEYEGITYMHRGIKDPGKTWSTAIPMTIREEDGSEREGFTGSIRLKMQLLEEPMAFLRTMLHEAVHRFIGAHDGASVKIGEKDVFRGYFDKWGRNLRITGMDRAEALWNADSYAWFIIKLANVEELARVLGICMRTKNGL